MVSENFYSKSMKGKTEPELLEYFHHHSDYQEEAVLAALWEIEKRGLATSDILSLKNDFEAREVKKPQATPNIVNESIELYTSNFILFFGVLFSVFAAGILVSLNFRQLKKLKLARIFLLSGLAYSFLQMVIFSQFKTTSPLISVATSLLGVYLLNYYSAKEMPEDVASTPRNVWYPILIAILITLPVAYIIMKSVAATL